MVFPIAQTGDLAERLAVGVRDAPETMSPFDKNEFYAALSEQLLAHRAHLQFCCWDIHDDPEEAVEEYWSWVEGTARDAEEEEPWKYGDEARYGFVTVLVLAPAGRPCARLLLARTQIDEEDHVSEATLEHLLTLLPTLDFRSATSDVVMVRPGIGGIGITESMLAHPAYHHLGPVI